MPRTDTTIEYNFDDFTYFRKLNEVEKKIDKKKNSKIKTNLKKFINIGNEIRKKKKEIYDNLCKLGNINNIDTLEREIICLTKKMPILNMRLITSPDNIKKLIKTGICPYCNGDIEIKFISNGRMADESTEYTVCSHCHYNFGKGNKLD